MTTDNNDDLEQSKPVDNVFEQFEPQSTDETPPPVESKAKIIKMRKPRAKKPAANDGDAAVTVAPEKEIRWPKYWELVKHFALIYGTSDVWDGINRIMMGVPELKLAYTREIANRWLNSEDCRHVMIKDVVFSPDGNVADNQINLFNGLELVPMKCTEADVKPMLDLIKYLCSSVSAIDDAEIDVTPDDMVCWVLRWLAYPLQHLGAKMSTALIFHGDEGAGKNLFFDVMKHIYGEYGTIVGQDQIDEKFNDWASRKLFVVGDEVLTRAELTHSKGKMKALVTGQSIQIASKFRATRVESNHMNMVFLSNELQPLALDNTDRRYCVVYTPPARDREFYQGIGDWLNNENGYAKWMYFLMHFDLGDFGENSKPPLTKAKSDLIKLSSKTTERFVEEWVSGALGLPVQTCTTDQIFKAYCKWGERNKEYLKSKSIFCREGLRKVPGVIEPDEVWIYKNEKRDKLIKYWRVITPDGFKTIPAAATSSTRPADVIAAQFEAFEVGLAEYLKGENRD